MVSVSFKAGAAMRLEYKAAAIPSLSLLHLSPNSSLPLYLTQLPHASGIGISLSGKEGLLSIHY